ELSDKEKWRAIDKIKGLKLGTTEAEHNKQEQAKREEQIRADERKKTLEELRKGWH
ncbi:replication initiation protein, partial [Levilactobacillus brevis]|nr:replication initiation protein [Levilactobacillus brevis]